MNRKSLYLKIALFLYLCLLPWLSWGQEKVDFEFECSGIEHTVKDNIKKDGVDMDNQRTTIGVAEKVTLKLADEYGKITWKIVKGDGTLTVINPHKAEFEASLDGSEVIIRATPEHPCPDKPFLEIPFTVIEPTLNYVFKCGMHEKDVCSAGMLLDICLMPANVSFHNLVVREINVKGVGTLALKGLNNKLWHIPGSPAPAFGAWLGPLNTAGITEFYVNTGKGTQMEAVDQVYLKLPGSFITGVFGTFYFDISSSYAKYNNTTIVKALPPSTVVQLHTLDAPKMTAEKGGNTYSAEVTSANTPTQFGDTECK